jgi:methionyl-tRNA formyltransferase
MTALVYFGDGLWATRCLEKLLSDGHRALAVVGRSNPSDTSLQELAKARGITLLTPGKVNAEDFVERIRALRPELNISMSYNQILRRPIIDTAPLGFINCHAGKLPRYRGRNVINWALINNETEIGLTIHYVNEGIDTGDIILQHCLPMAWTDGYGDVLSAVRDAFPGLLSRAVSLLAVGKAPRQPQNHALASYFTARREGDEWIDWRDSSLNIYNKIRAITAPGAGARARMAGERITLWRARYETAWPAYIATPGEVVGREDGGIRVKTGDSTILLTEIESTKISFPIGARFELAAGPTCR